jgi:ABC-type Fe3+-hydroxamate transport system substrate-binding protein
MAVYTDQMGRKIALDHTPKRIISLVPSQTELLHTLGLGKEVIGITKFCVHPHQWFLHKIKIGGTKQLDIDKIRNLQPDLIIANKEENEREQIEELASHFPVWISSVSNLKEALSMISSIGDILDKKKESQELVKAIQINFASFTPLTSNVKPKTCYLIWREPYMTVGGDTFINDMLKRAGLQNMFADKTRYPEITINQLSSVNCQLLLLSSEPYPFKEKHIVELQIKLPGTKIILADGELFSWYGSHLLKAPAYFQKLHQQIKTFELI